MDVAGVYLELFGRLLPLAEEAVDGLAVDQLVWQPNDDTNPIGWLVWHATRVQDDHVADVMDVEQLWATGEWAASFGLEPDASNSGYGHTPEEVRAVRPASAAAILAYVRAVDARTKEYLATLTDADLDRIVDRNWTPPVTLGVRLVSVADDTLQHLGQAAYVRGLLAPRPSDA